jgi:hypothetical protein
VWFQRLAYLADIFTKINELHFSFQGMTVAIIASHEKLSPYAKWFWRPCIEKLAQTVFGHRMIFLNDLESQISGDVLSDLMEHL